MGNVMTRQIIKLYINSQIGMGS